MKHKFLFSLGLASSILLLGSCQDEEFGFSKQEIRDSVYDRNFIAKYGEIDPEQNWDLSKYANNGNRHETRAEIPGCGCPDGIDKKIEGAQTGWGANGHVETVNEWFFVEDQLVKEFNTKLPEEDSDNQKQGVTGFNLHSNGVFYIIPMYQGQSGLGSELHMVVTYGGVTYDNMIWSRSKDIYRQSEGSFDWKSLYNGHDDFANVDYYNDTQAGKYLASTRDAKGIKTKPIKCDIPYGAEIKFYLHIQTGHVPYRSHVNDMDGTFTGANGYEAKLALTGDRMWSDKGKMIQLNSEGFHVTNAGRYGKEFMIIACEDAWGKKDNHTASYTTDRNIRNKNITINPSEWNGDDDMNDLVFLFVSDDLPSVIEANQVRKRYIIEDLGSIVDWDFNDVVVDLAETTDPITEAKSQKAVLKHLCGTTPFELYIGPAGDVANSTKLNFSASNITYTDYKGASQTFSISNGYITGQQMAQKEELNIEFQLPSTNPWDPSENNIWVKVYEEKDKYPNRADPNGGANFGGNVDKDHNDNYNYDNINSTPGDGNGVINGEIDNDFNLSSFQVVAFPRKGKVPRIIAVDTDYEWTAEDIDITPALWESYTISAATTSTDNKGQGTVSGAGRYKGGRTVTLTATPEPGNIFVKWSNGSTERTLTFTANANVSYTAEFKNVTDPQGFPINISNQFGQATLDIKQLLIDGYNTIKVYAADNANGSFGLKSNGKSTLDYIVAGDASDYKIVNGVGTVVLTEDQIKEIEDDSKTITVVSRTQGITLNKVSLLNTQDYFTVELMPIEGQHGEITTADNDRFSGDWNADDTPYKNNGRRPFVKASYAAPTDNDPDAPGCVLTAVPDEGYYFVKWEQYDGSELLNTDTQNPITVKNDAKLKAVFAEQPTLTLQLDDNNKDDFDLYINGVNSTSAKVTPGTVEIKAKKKDGKSNSDYQFMWTGVAGIEDSGEDAATSITMPAQDVTITCTVLYKTTPQSHLSTANDNSSAGQASFDYGDITLTWNGRTKKNESLYAPIGAQITATATPKTGYRFKTWRWSTITNATQTYTRGNDKKEIWQPQALFVEQKYTLNVYATPAEGGTVQIGEGSWGTNVSEDILEGKTVWIRAKANTNYEFVKWTAEQTDANRQVTVTDNMSPGAKFGKILLNSASQIQYQSGQGWQNYTFNLMSYKSELSTNSNTFIITMDTRVNRVQFMLNGWDTSLSAVNVADGKCVVTFTDEQISSINSASQFFMHVLNPETTSQNLQNANVTKIVCYKE